MSTIIPTVTGNTSPSFELTLERKEDDGISTVIDLSQADHVDLIIKNDQTNEVTNTGHQTTDIGSPASNGVVTYDPQDDDFPDVGRYIGDVKITYISGKVEVLYDQVIFPARANIS